MKNTIEFHSQPFNQDLGYRTAGLVKGPLAPPAAQSV